MAHHADKQEPPSLEDFAERLDAAQRGTTDAEAAKRGQAMGQGFRLASELLAAMLVGPGLGWVVDRFAGTSPWGLLAGIFIGFAAGVMNVARAMQTPGEELDGDNNKNGPASDGSE